jgi:uncharacterized protein YecE (DUF72 family)
MTETFNILIGTAGFSYKDWEGIVYPRKTRGSPHPIESIARYFDLVEINTSFYGHIKPAMGKQWTSAAAAVNPNFVFTAKLNRAFTHSPVAVVEATSAATMRPTDEDEQLAKEGLDAIAGEGKLGALLAQFPVSFKNDEANREYLDTLLHRFGEYPLAVEVRHQSWNNDETLRDFTHKGVAFCNIDQPMLGRSLGPTEHVTSAIAYVRLHGRRYDQWFTAQRPHDRYDYLYTHDELEGWKSRIERLAEKAGKTFVVANNHFKGKAAANALELKHMLSGRPVQAPETLVRTYPELEAITVAIPQSR